MNLRSPGNFNYGNNLKSRRPLSRSKEVFVGCVSDSVTHQNLTLRCVRMPPKSPNSGGLSRRDAETRRRTRGGDALLHRCGGGLNRPPIGNHQIEDFDGGLLTLGAYRPRRGAWDTERDPSGVSGASPRHPVESGLPQNWGLGGFKNLRLVANMSKC